MNDNAEQNEEQLSRRLRGSRALVVSSVFPYPPHDAARIDVADRIRVLHELGLEVDLLASVRSGESPVLGSGEGRHHVNRFYCVPRSERITDHFHLDPYQVVSRKGFSQLALEVEYDFVILEGHYVAPVLDNPSLRARHVLLRVNNDERRYFLRLASSCGFGVAGAYHLLDALKFCRQWPGLMRKVDIWMFSSSAEYARFERFAHRAGARNVLLLPHVESFVPPRETESRGVLFLGSLFMPNNLEAVRWYLQNVHPHLTDIPGYCFEIAGNTARGNAKANVDRLLGGSTAARLSENPADLETLYARNAVFVNPMLNGAGIKLKTVHALANGMPVVATSIGNEGTGLRDGADLFETNDPAVFTKHVRSLLMGPRMGAEIVRSGQARMRLRYRQHLTLGQLLVDLLDTGDSGENLA